MNIQRLIREKTAFPVQFMVSAAVSKLGKARMVFISKGLRLDSQAYQDEVLDKLVPDMKRLSGNDYIFQQDGAKCHTSASTLSYLVRKSMCTSPARRTVLQIAVTLIPWIISSGRGLRVPSTGWRSHRWSSWKNESSNAGASSHKVRSTMRLMDSEND